MTTDEAGGKTSGLFLGHNPSGQEVTQNLAGRVGSGQVVIRTLTGRAGTGRAK